MIHAERGGLRGFLWARYVRHAVKRAFHGVWIRGPLPESRERLLVYASHPSWWDGFAFHELCVTLGLEAHALMEEPNLRRYPFLRRLGAFSIRRGDPSSALESLRYAVRLLEQPRAAVAVFPQGALTPNASAPLTLERGVEVLARAAKATCVPLAIRPAFLGERKPDLLLEFGTAHRPAPVTRFQQGLDDAVRSLASVTSLQGFTPLYSLAEA